MYTWLHLDVFHLGHTGMRHRRVCFGLDFFSLHHASLTGSPSLLSTHPTSRRFTPPFPHVTEHCVGIHVEDTMNTQSSTLKAQYTVFWPISHLKSRPTVARGPNFSIPLTFSVQLLTFKVLQDQNIAFNVYHLTFIVQRLTFSV